MRRDSAGASAVIAGIPLGCLVLVCVLGVGFRHEQGNGYVDTGTIWVVQGLLGGGSVVLLAAGVVSGWRQVGGRSAMVPPLALVAGGVVMFAAWLFAFASAYGS